MNKPAKTLTRFFATVALVSGLVACGSGDTTLPSDGNENPTTLNVTLTSPATVTTKTGTIGRNYLDLAAPWTDWSGETSRVIYDSTANELIIPAPARGNDMVLGVQRYDMKLGTRRYSLNIDSASADVAAFIFVFNDRGELLALDASNGPFVAQPGQPFHFDAPPNSAGFYVQVQSGWQVNDPASIRPRLTDIGNLLGDNLIDPRGPWTDWDGNAAKVSYNGLINRLVIQGPEADEPVNYGIQRLTGTLTSGQTYELSVKSGSTIGSSVLLFLVDVNGALIPFTDAATGATRPWLIVTGESSADVQGGSSDHTPVQFDAPSGVAEIVVQIQSPWNQPHGAVIIPGLRAVATQ